MILEKLVEENNYPIVFIGSGISKRYLKDAPDWITLLFKLWDKNNPSIENSQENFYSFLNTTRQEIIKENPEYSNEEVNHHTNIVASALLEKDFNKNFVKGVIKVSNFTQKDFFNTQISPYKKEIANYFSELSIKEEMEEEYKKLAIFLKKIKMIFTTNYDNLIENTLILNNPNYKFKKYVGQKGFFSNSSGWSELLKIHGCITEPGSIVISSKDYEEFDSKSVLISAKLISALITNPIIFLGYSLTDLNVRKIIKDFSSSLEKEDRISMSDRVILIEREEGLNEIIEEKYNDKDLGCELTVIRTDDFGTIYETLNEINQGLPPSVVMQYEDIFKEMIIERGREGSLQTLLLSPIELEELEANHDLRKNSAVVIGDARVVYQLPDNYSYFIDYFSDSQNYYTDVALKFIASQLPRTQVPFSKYTSSVDINKDTTLMPFEKDKLKARIANKSSISKIKDTIPPSNRKKYPSVGVIKDQKHSISKECDLISFNINNLPKDEVRAYILEELNKALLNGEYKVLTNLRKLCCIFDLLYYRKQKTT